MSRLVAAALGCLAACGTLAEIRLAGFFGDHMVLHWGCPIPVGGTATSGEMIEVDHLDAPGCRFHFPSILLTEI